MAENFTDLLIEKAKVINPNRVLIYGSRGMGAVGIGRRLEEAFNELDRKDVSIGVVHDVAFIDKAFYNRDEQDKDRLPQMVAVLPEMRQYYLGKAMSIPIHGYEGQPGSNLIGYIAGLCESHDIPMFSQNF